jgi:hypothetical protein
VKIYSSSSHLRKAVKDDVVDPYLALPDERAQRGLQELCVSKSLSSSTGSVATTIGSVPTIIGSLSLTLLEMSMTAANGSLPTASVQDEVVDPFLGLPDEEGWGGLQELSMPSSTGSVATTVGSMPLTLLEMSMPAANGSLPTASVQDEVVDPFLGLPDEKGQGGIQELSMPSSTGSVATTIGSITVTHLEMSMPTTIGSVPPQSFPYFHVPVQSGTIELMKKSEPIFISSNSHQ